MRLLLQLLGTVCICVSVCLVPDCFHNREPYKNGLTDRGTVCGMDSCVSMKQCFYLGTQKGKGYF